MTKPYHELRTRSVPHVAIPYGADLHVHTTHSDGALTPCAVVNAAAQAGLRALAITDHDTVSALETAQPEADRLGIELVAGVEWTAEMKGKEIHLLGLFIDPRHPKIVETSNRMRKARWERIWHMAQALKRVGVSVDLDEVVKRHPRAALGRSHAADLLVETGQVRTRQEAFLRYLDDDGPVAVPKPRLPFREAIDLTREAGGVAALAHPPYAFRRPTLNTLVEAGLGAIEIPRGGFTAAARRWYEWAIELDLIVIHGSDFHALFRHRVGMPRTSDLELERLRARSQILFDHRATESGPAGVLEEMEE